MDQKLGYSLAEVVGGPPFFTRIEKEAPRLAEHATVRVDRKDRFSFTGQL